MNRRQILSGIVAAAFAPLLPKQSRRPYPPLAPTAWRVDYESAGITFQLFLNDVSRAQYFAKHIRSDGNEGTVRLVQVSLGMDKILKKNAQAEAAWFERFRNGVESRAT